MGTVRCPYIQGLFHIRLGRIRAPLSIKRLLVSFGVAPAERRGLIYSMLSFMNKYAGGRGSCGGLQTLNCLYCGVDLTVVTPDFVVVSASPRMFLAPRATETLLACPRAP